MKKKIPFILLLLAGSFSAQEPKSLYIKGNALFLPVGIYNMGAELQLNNKYTLQGDFFISPWKSFSGNHAQIYMGHLEGRYYFQEAFRKWYIGISAGTGVFDLTKWNYFGTDKYQRGFNFMLGATVGYQFRWSEKWNIDVFLGAGTVQSQYHGYAPTEEQPGFYRYDGASGWNKSGEFLPYRGGIMIAYKLK